MLLKIEKMLILIGVILFCLIVMANSGIKYNKFEINNVVRAEKYTDINVCKKTGWIEIKSNKNNASIRIYRNGEEIASFTNNIILNVSKGDIIELQSTTPAKVKIARASGNIIFPHGIIEKYIDEKISLLCRIRMR